MIGNPLLELQELSGELDMGGKEGSSPRGREWTRTAKQLHEPIERACGEEPVELSRFLSAVAYGD